MAWRPDYATTADLKAYLRIEDSDDDAQLAMAISAASRSVEKSTNRQFGQVASAEARFYTGRYDQEIRRWVVDLDDLGDVTGLLVAADLDDTGGFASTVTNYSLRPVNALSTGHVYTQLVVNPASAVQFTTGDAAVRVTAKWGWTAVPSAITQATLMQASRVHARRDSPFGVTGSPDQGGELRLLAKVDPDVAVILRPYYRWEGTVR